MEVVRILHMAKSRAGITDDEYRLILRDAAGVCSSKDIRGKAQYEGCRAAFRKLGVDIPAWHGGGRKDRQLGKAYAIWCSLHSRGLVEDKSWKAMEAFAKRMFGGQDILTGGQKSHLIEILKKWEDRSEDGDS